MSVLTDFVNDIDEILDSDITLKIFIFSPLDHIPECYHDLVKDRLTYNETIKEDVLLIQFTPESDLESVFSSPEDAYNRITIKIIVEGEEVLIHLDSSHETKLTIAFDATEVPERQVQLAYKWWDGGYSVQDITFDKKNNKILRQAITNIIDEYFEYPEYIDGEEDRMITKESNTNGKGKRKMPSFLKLAVDNSKTGKFKE